MKKYMKIGAWICSGIAAVLMLLGSVAAIFGGGKLFNHFWANYFYPSTSFIVAAILLLMWMKADKD